MRENLKPAIVTAILAGINVIVFFLDIVTGNRLLDAFELSASSVCRDGQIYRILTAAFLHGGIEHLFNNMLILIFLGAMIEKVIGHLPYLVLYLLSAIGGNVLSLLYKLLTDSSVASIGASGAIFGLDGVMFAMILVFGGNKENLTIGRVLLMIGLSLYSGFQSTNIDNAAHIGGLVTGFLAGLVCCLFLRRKKTRMVKKELLDEY